MTKFIVNRSKWICGLGLNDSTAPVKNYTKKSHGYGATSLLNSQDYQCCLGFVCQQVLDQHKINLPLRNKISPLGILDGKLPPPPIQLRAEEILKQEKLISDYLTPDAITINDNRYTLLTTKEKKLIELFNKYGHELVFTGKYNTDTD